MYLIGYAVFGLMSSQFCYLSCISYANAPTATVLQTLSTVLTMLISCMMAHRLPRGNEALSLVLAVLGTFLLATRGDFTQMQLSSGVLFWGAAIAVAGTAYNLLPKRLLDRRDRDVVLSYGMLIGGTVLSLASRLWAIEVHIAPVGKTQHRQQKEGLFLRNSPSLTFILHRRSGGSPHNGGAGYLRS